MVKMWKRIPKVVPIVVLVALIGGIDVLFGCCMDNDPESHTPLQTLSVTNINGERVYNELAVPIDDSESAGGIRRFLPKTKTDVFNAVLFGFVVLFGGLLFLSVMSTSAKKGDIVQRAEKLGESLQHQSKFKQEKVDFVQDLLCKSLPGSTERPPLNITTQSNVGEYNTTIIDTYQGNSTEIDTNQGSSTQIDSYENKDTEIDINEVGSTQVPIQSTEFIEGIDVDDCKRIGTDIYYMLSPVAPNTYKGAVAGNEFGTFFDDIKRNITEASQYNCGNGFFEVKGPANDQRIYFNARNDIVRDAINDATCQRAAVELFPHLEVQLPNHNVNSDLKYNFEDTAFVYKNLQDPTKIAKNKNCGSDYLYFRAEKTKWRLTYKAVNPHISKAAARYNTEKACRNVAYDIVLCIQSKGTISKTVVATKTFLDTHYLKDKLDAATQVIEQNYCGSGFFTITRGERKSNVEWRNANPYIKEAVKKAEANGNCMKSALAVAKHLQAIGLYSKEDDNTLAVPNILDDVSLLIQATKITGPLNCGNSFFRVTTDSDDNFVLSYNKNNAYVYRAMATVGRTDQCKLAAKGVLRRLIELGKHSPRGTNEIFVDEPELLSDLKGKIDRVKWLDCRDGFFTYTGNNNGITISYDNDGYFIRNVERNLRTDIWCPKAAYTYSYILHDKGHRMEENSEGVSITLNDKEKELITTANTQLSEVDCGINYYRCFLRNDRATISWHSINPAVKKGWTDTRTKFAPLY